jgi:hypothetical protein
VSSNVNDDKDSAPAARVGKERAVQRGVVNLAVVTPKIAF